MTGRRATAPKSLVLAALLSAAPVIVSATTQPPGFSTEQEAQQACPNDIVVWLNLKSGFYHYKGQPWYGHTQVGAYVCKAEADQAGDRPGDLPIGSGQ